MHFAISELIGNVLCVAECFPQHNYSEKYQLNSIIYLHISVQLHRIHVMWCYEIQYYKKRH